MTSNKSQEINNEAEIRTLIERWAKAVREENRAAIRLDHDSDILMFDVPPPFLSQGLDAYGDLGGVIFLGGETCNL
jgi:ketosteroid isomerase-like protein